jgi:hypothetical protein
MSTNTVTPQTSQTSTELSQIEKAPPIVTHETSPVSSQIEKAPPIVTPPYTPPHTPRELYPPPPKLVEGSPVYKVYEEILSVVMKNILGNILHNITNLDNFLHDICYSKCLIILLLIRLLTIFLYNNNYEQDIEIINNNYEQDIEIINNILIFIYVNESVHEHRHQIFENIKYDIKYDITDLIYDYTYIYIKEEEEREGNGEIKKEAEADAEADVEAPKKKKRAVGETKQVSDEDKLMMKIYNNVDFALIIINDMVLRYFQDCWENFLSNLSKQKLQSNNDFDIEVDKFLENEKRDLITIYSYFISDICNDYYDMSQDKKYSLYSIRRFCPLKTTTSIEMVNLDVDDVNDDDNDIIVVQEVADVQERDVLALLEKIYKNNSIQSLTENYKHLKSISLQILIDELNSNIERNHSERKNRIDKRENSVREEFAARMKKILDDIRNDTSSSTRTRPSSNRSTRKVEPYSILTAIPQDRQSAILSSRRGAILSSRRGAILLAARQYIQGKINKKTIEIIIEIHRAINLFIKYNNNDDDDDDICITIKNIIGYNDSYSVILSDEKVKELNKLYDTLKTRWSDITEDVLGHSHIIQDASEVLKTPKGGKSLKKITNRKTRKRKNRKSRKHKNKRSKNNKNKRHFKIRSYKL